MVLEDVVVLVLVTITKLNDHTRVDAEDAERMGDIGWRISSMNQVFMSSFRQNRRLDYMNYKITEAPPPLQPKSYSQCNCVYYI